MNTKIKLFLRIFLVTLFFAFSSCEKDLYEEQIQSTYKKRDITFKQFINETGLTNFDTSITIPPKPTDIQGKTVDGKYELTDFDIDTDVIKSMEFQQKITYSLKVHPKDTISENFFNLIVYKKNNVWEKLIIEMKPSPENLNELQNGLTDNFEGQMRKLYDSSPPPPDMSACVEITITSYHCTGCFGECNCTKTCCVTTLTYNTCDFGSGTPGDSGGFGGNQSGNLGNSGSSGSGDGTWNNGTGGSTPSPDDIVIEPNLDPSSITALGQTIDSQNFQIDNDASLNSPAFIDLSLVKDTSAVSQKFRCVYDKLLQSNSFKNLFVNTFGVNDKINVKFEISDNLPISTQGNCALSSTTTNGVTSYLNTIKINKKILEDSDPNALASIIIAKVILHEFIHAYLNIKKINCNSGATIPEINNLELNELISSFYQGFNCEIDVNGSPQSQHSFMFDFMMPTFKQILSEIRDSLIPQNQITIVEGYEFVNTDLNITEPWNWDHFYKYLSLSGLHNCGSFQESIANDPTEMFLFNTYIVNGNHFTKSCN